MVLKGFLLSVFLFLFINTACAGRLILGFYGFTVKSDIDMIADSPFQYLMPYGTEGKEEAFIDDFLNYASKKNIKIIFSLKDIYIESRWYPKIKWCPTEDKPDLIKCIVKRFGDHESVHGWYLADEPTLHLGIKKSSKLARNAKAIRRFSSKPIFADDFPIPRGKLWKTLSETSDVFMTHIYPIPEKSLHDVHTAIQELSASYNKPVIAVLQVHGKYQYPFYKRDKNTGRPPTYEEIRVMSYLALIAGAEGIIYYSFSDIKKLPDFDQRWRFLKKLGDELESNYQLINSRETVAKDYRFDKDINIYTLIRHYKDKDYFIGVNPTNSKKLITIFSLHNNFIKKLELQSFDVKIITLKESRNRG